MTLWEACRGKDLAVLQTRDENMHSIPSPLRMLGRSVIDGSSRVPYWNWQGYLRMRGALAHHGMFFKRYELERQDEGAAMQEFELLTNVAPSPFALHKSCAEDFIRLEVDGRRFNLGWMDTPSMIQSSSPPIGVND